MYSNRTRPNPRTNRRQRKFPKPYEGPAPYGFVVICAIIILIILI
jgi:hypothetical protein